MLDNPDNKERDAYGKGWIAICYMCEEEFHTLRYDTKTCSKRCKQRLYRERLRLHLRPVTIGDVLGQVIPKIDHVTLVSYRRFLESEIAVEPKSFDHEQTIIIYKTILAYIPQPQNHKY